MGKKKKKHSKKDDASDNLLGIAALSVKKFRKVAKEIGKLSTGQKLAGGIALVAAGLTYLAQQETAAAPKALARDAPPPLADKFETDDSKASVAAPRKNHKSAKIKPAADA